MGVNLCRKTFDNYIREDGWMSYIVRLVCVAVVAVLQFKRKRHDVSSLCFSVAIA